MRPMYAPKAVLIVVAAAALAAAGGAAADTTSATDGPLKATFSASTHHPNCKQKWPVTVTASYNGKPAHASAYYQFLYQDQVVSTQYPFSSTSKNPHNRVWNFYKSFYDNTFGPFGANAVGQSLTVRAVVTVVAGKRRYTAYPSYSVQVVAARGCKPSH